MTASVRTVSCTLVASLGLHGLLLLLAAWLIAVMPVWTKDRNQVVLPSLTPTLREEAEELEQQEVEVSFLSLTTEPEMPAHRPPPETSPAASSTNRMMTVRPREDQPALAPFNADTPFISSQNMRAASTSAPTAGADPSLMNQEGLEGVGLSLTSAKFTPGSEAQPANASRPPEPPAPESDSPDPVTTAGTPPPPQDDRPPEPAAVVKTSDPLAPAPVAKPAEALPMREAPPDSLNLTKAADSSARPKSSPLKPRDPIVTKPNSGQVNRSPVLSSVKTKSTGSMDIRGDKASVDARDTPEGRYNNTVYAQVGLLWNMRLSTVRGLAGLGTVEVEFDIDARGRVSNVRLVDPGKANPVLEDVCLSSIIKAKLPPPPAEMQRELSDPLSGGKLRRKFTFHRL